MEFSAPTAEEFDFVFDSWIRSFKKSPWAGCVSNAVWFDVQRSTIREILDRGAHVVVASTPISGREDEYPAVRRVMGYAVTEPKHNVLHWLYVKDDFRGFHVGTALLNAVCPTGDWTYSHRTNASSKFLGRRFKHDPVTARVKELR